MVMPSRGGSVYENDGRSPVARASASSTSSSANGPASVSSIARTSGISTSGVRWRASRPTSSATSGTALRFIAGIDACPASPSAVTRTGSVAFSPTLMGIATRPSASSMRTPPPSLSA